MKIGSGQCSGRSLSHCGAGGAVLYYLPETVHSATIIIPTSTPEYSTMSFNFLAAHAKRFDYFNRNTDTGARILNGEVDVDRTGVTVSLYLL